MYNYSIDLSYREKDNDTIYRKELLNCFGFKEYTDDINLEIEKIFKKVREHYKNIITNIKNKNMLGPFSEIDDLTCFTILFSWEYFYENHQILKSILSQDPHLQENITNLTNKINLLSK
tara:strand:- start:446 stop:802 length:357 start_codon:yes stop_codon:yes gene_type:complete